MSTDGAMRAIYLITGGLFLAVAGAPALLDRDRPAAPEPALSLANDTADVPDAAREALRQGRHWRASRILREYLAHVPDPAPETILLAARAEAGLGDWRRVHSLLAGRNWLDSVGGGWGWRLLGRSELELGAWSAGDEALRHYLQVAQDAGERDRGIVAVRRAEGLAKGGDTAAALAAYRAAAALLPQIADWIAIAAAGTAAAVGDTAAVRDWLSRTDQGLAEEWGWRARMRGRRAAGDLRGALAAAEAAASRLELATRRADAWVAAGELRLLLRDTLSAKAAFRQAMQAAPGTVAGLDAARRLSGLPGATPHDRLRVGRLYLRHGNMVRGLDGLRAYLDSGTGTAEERAEVSLELGRAQFRAGRFRDAERLFLTLAEQAPGPRAAAEALFQAGRAQLRDGRGDAARATFLRTAARFPDQDAAARALFLVADLDHDADRLASAREHYRRTVAVPSDADEVGQAWMRLVGMAFTDGDAAAAAALLEEYRERFPSGRRFQQATYWAGLAYRRLAQDERARERFREARRADPLSYYGGQAAEALGEPVMRMPLESSPRRNAAVEEEVAGGLARIDLLRHLGWDSFATFEVDRLKRHLGARDGALYAMAEAYNERGLTMAGIAIGWEIYRAERVWNPRLLRIIYPFPFREIIEAEARDRGVNPYLAAGLIRQESMFNATARSPAGALGLMQVMPATGRELAREIGLQGYNPDMLQRPEINVVLGMAYLRKMLRHYDHRLTSVLAAYNAGPGRVSRWSRFPEFRDEELFAERIPFQETRHYVQVVQQNARIYAGLYGDASGALGE
jgi:soluble lytic murein transglycosylase